MRGGEFNAYKNYTGMHRVQAEKLQHNEGKEESSRSYGDKEVLQILQASHIT